MLKKLRTFCTALSRTVRVDTLIPIFVQSCHLFFVYGSGHYLWPGRGLRRKCCMPSKKFTPPFA